MDPYKRAIWYGVYDPAGQEAVLAGSFCVGLGAGVCDGLEWEKKSGE